ncbi:MAG: pyrroline-5-carboxylate reductase dimerization domain-containing protein [Paracoccaceae bacterium]
MRVGIIGGTGWLGGALGRALIARAVVSAGDLVILNRSGAREYSCHPVVWAADLADLVARVDVVVISVRPGDWPALGLIAPGRLVISFMAGVDMAALAACGGRVVRAMPNAAAEVAASYTPWVAGPRVTAADRASVARVLGAIGPQEELPDEGQITLMTALSGAGPAFPALMATAMLRFLTDRGVAAETAARAVDGTVCASARLLEGRMAEAPAMVQTFIDYAGTTCAGLQAAEAAGFSQALQEGLQAAVEKALLMQGPGAT